MAMTTLLLWAAIAAALVLPIAFVVAVRAAKRAEKKKAEAWARKALELGFEHAPESHDFHTRFPFELFKLGEIPEWQSDNRFLQSEEGRTYDLLTGEVKGRRVTLGEYRYTSGSGEQSEREAVAVCVIETPGLDLPKLLIRPGAAPQPGLFGKLLDLVLPGELVRFADDPGFSSCFMVVGSDEARVREALTPERRDLLTARASELARYEIEACGDAILVSTRRSIGPERARELLDVSLSVAGQLTA